MSVRERKFWGEWKGQKKYGNKEKLRAEEKMEKKNVTGRQTRMMRWRDSCDIGKGRRRSQSCWELYRDIMRCREKGGGWIQRVTGINNMPAQAWLIKGCTRKRWRRCDAAPMCGGRKQRATGV